MPGYTLVPVDYQPDFDDYSLVPVDHDPFAADDIIQRARTQQKSQPQPLANGTGQPNVGAPANNAQAAVVLLHHKFRRLCLEALLPQQGHRGRVLMSALIKRKRMVAIEFGMWRSGRKGGSPGSITVG